MISKCFGKIRCSRRRFMQFMAGTSLASISGTLLAGKAWATPSMKRTIPLPKFNVSISDKTAAERYQCKPELKRFGSEDMAFKVISEELGTSSAKAMMANLIRNVKNGKIGHGWPVEDPIEARMFFALNIAATTWNNFIGPYGENRENRNFLSWLPKGLPADLTAEPLPLKETADVTKKIKVISVDDTP